MEWVVSTLTPPPNVVCPALLKLMRTPRLPAVDWTDAPTDLNGLVRFGERRKLVSAGVPSRSARAIQTFAEQLQEGSTERLVFIRLHHVNEIPPFSITVTFIAWSGFLFGSVWIKFKSAAKKGVFLLHLAVTLRVSTTAWYTEVGSIWEFKAPCSAPRPVWQS